MTTDIKYDIVVDVDGVLLDIHQALQRELQDRGYNFDMSNVLTYDFNRNLPACFNKMRDVPLSAIYDTLREPSIFNNAVCDWDAIMLIRKYAEQNIKFLIYTISPSMEVRLIKQRLFNQWFGFMPNVTLLSIITDEKYHKPAVQTFSVIEDSHANLAGYDDTTERYLVNKSYNQAKYNPTYAPVFNHPRLHRCENTSDAIQQAYNHVRYLHARTNAVKTIKTF